MGLSPAVFRGLFADIRGQELSIRHPSRVDIRIGIGGGCMVDMPSYHHTFLVAQELGLIAVGLRDNFPENYEKVKIPA